MDEKDTAASVQPTIAATTAARMQRSKGSFFNCFSIFSPAERMR